MGSDRRPSHTTVRSRNAGLLRVLDCLLGGDRQAAEDRGVQRLAPGRSRRGHPATQPAQVEIGTSWMLGLTVPPSLLARADEVIE